MRRNLELEDVLVELTENIELFDDHIQEFIKSITKIYDRLGKLSQLQEDWAYHYYNDLIQMLDEY